MKQATVIVSFYDMDEGVPRKTQDSFTCSDERGVYLEKLGLVWLKDAPEEKPKKKAAKTAKAK